MRTNPNRKEHSLTVRLSKLLQNYISSNSIDFMGILHRFRSNLQAITKEKPNKALNSDLIMTKR